MHELPAHAYVYAALVWIGLLAVALTLVYFLDYHK